ncbi:NAD-dependent epimerase/dehydratase family protein [Candidatus Peregrinibacteria bacterium]|nr:NAD-dependent epimerase/dehydratase family protein [Candidatus Peregrinibacteria bacterium]
MKPRILVTGGAGFIGSNFCNTHKEKYEVIALDNLLLGDERNLDPEVKFIKGDACNVQDLEKIGKVDYVVHLAGTSSAPMFTGDGFINGYVNSVKSFCTVLEWARKNGVKKMLYASTSSLYGNNPLPLTEDQHIIPQNHYAITKYLYERCAESYWSTYKDIEIIGFRFMSVYGPNEEAKGKYANIISQFAWDIARDLAPVIYGNGKQFRDFTHVSDVVSGMTLAIDTDQKLGAAVFNIGTGKSCTLNEIVEALSGAFGKKVEPKYIPNPVKEIYIHGQCADISKIQKVLGYEPKVKLTDGIADQVKNLRMERIRETSSDVWR